MPYVSDAQGASTTAYDARASFRRFRLIFLAGLLALSLLAIEAPAATQAKPSRGRSEAQRIVQVAGNQIGARFRLGTEGPRRFDCSGLIYYVYRRAGLLNRIGGKRRLAAGYYHWFKRRGMASRSNPKVGDLVVWRKKGGSRITHSGIYIGNGRVISALVNPWGVRRTRLTSLRGTRLVAFLHVRLER